MIQDIVKDVFFLGKKSEDASEADRQVITDLVDTLRANHDRCVGMAANMIGVRKKIIIVNSGLSYIIMVNPKIISKKEKYETEEGCLSLVGERRTERYKEIEVEYLDRSFNKCRQIFKGYVAQIIQHEIDHCNGIII